jgi:hypothetical protein
MPTQPSFTFRSLAIRLALAAVLIGALVYYTIYFSTGRSRQAARAAANATQEPAKPTRRGNASSPTAAASASNPRASAKAGDGDQDTPTFTPSATRQTIRDFATLSGLKFVTQTDRPTRFAPRVEMVPVKLHPYNYAIWGSVGSDEQGSIWFGVSSHDMASDPADLYQYDPLLDKVIPRGNTLQKLRQARFNARHVKIHSRIIQGGDGYLYFSSMDEEGGFSRELSPSMLWRAAGPDYEWEPLMHAPELLIAVAGYGADIYALGDPGHVLYHFDTRTGKHRRVVVGTVPGHITRNFVVDVHGHAYVPRIRPGVLNSDPLIVELVQYNNQLQEVASTQLEHYLSARPADSHGIISFTTLADRSIVFATHHGRLYQIVPSATPGGAAKVSALGWFHPQGQRYTSTMHSIDGARYLVGISRANRPQAGQPAFEWLTYDLWLKESTAQPLDIPVPAGHEARNMLIYGSMARDRMGSFYVVGTHLNASEPLLVKLTLGRH